MPRIDFKALADTALLHAASLLEDWLPKGHRVGFEWKSINPTRSGDRSEGSFSVNINTGAWGDFATDDKGGDLIALCAYLFHSGDQIAAAREVAERIGYTLPEMAPTERQHRSGRKPAASACASKADGIENKPKKRSAWSPILPVPEDAPAPPVAHVVRGKPSHAWCYHDAEGRVLGYMWRFVTSDGGKEIIPLTFCANETTGKREWRHLTFPEPRPFYGLDRLAAKPEATVLIVEGEKCADVAHEQLPDLAVVSWPGGGKAVDKADWSPLEGRRVVIWPDCDDQADKRTGERLPEEKQPGWKAASRIAEILHALGSKVWTLRIPAPGEKPSGWDVADAVAEGLTGEALVTWMRERRQLHAPAEKPPDTPDFEPADADAGEPPPDDDWASRLHYTKRDGLSTCVANVHDIMLNVRDWQGVLGFDEFAQRTVKFKAPPYFGGAEGEWDSTDDTRSAMWLTRAWRFTPTSAIVAEAVETLAKAYTFHPVRDWLRALPAWDGTSRLEMWLIDYCGAPDTEYVRIASRLFLIGMVARVMTPGCKFDYCLVLEGTQGKGKSTVARILGGDWYGDTDLDLHNKDSMSALRGKWVYEVAEMGAMARAEASRQKSFLSRQFDEFRPVYGRREIRLPRQVVFIGTTNEWEWIKDPTGGRRFWPVDCSGEFNLNGLREVREQLFAEALAMFSAGERYYPSADEQKRLFDPEQLLREQPESLIDALHDWVFEQVAEFSVADAALTGLKLDASKLTRDLTTRIGIALRKLGCTKIEKRNGMTRFWYKPPERKGATATSVQPSSREQGEHHAPF